ncbi:hypothetical protein KI688_009886 [Linnemannia hyalina]|uniref:Uncharacterized protein n=1 Tax=Linnemannia hyalina TaxID=64524 RepID=A0A9P8BVB7_9FUNG|nr:hypothetical protein KI688_009886 [Linnemannia hyalina]
MIRPFPLVAVFAMLATFCLSTTSAIPVAKRDVTSTAECVQGHWELVRDLLRKLPEAEKGNVTDLFEGNEPITTAPSVDDIKTGLDDLKKYNSDIFLTFLALVKCDQV